MQIEFKPFDDQRPGTAGLRKKVTVFRQPHYLESFVEAVFRCAPGLSGGSMVIGGDGRYYNDTAIQTIVRMAEAHGVNRVIVAQDGLLSTPAASNLIRASEAAGGFILTASHNPAGADGDFGIKFNVAGGGQASERLTEDIYRCTRTLTAYEITDLPAVDLSRPGTTSTDSGMTVEVVDAVEDYCSLMQALFDFNAIRDLLQGGFRMRYDAMHAVTGPYARRIFAELLGAQPESLLNINPMEDFAGGHPDPNLVNARDLVDLMMDEAAPDFAAASDGDGDRNMILGRNIFVSPCDSLAVLTASAHRFPGYSDGLAGVARSMPTSRAVDEVAAALGIPCYETPTGWRFFCNLLEDGRIGFCGEESFGTSSHHSREKDGLWAVLAWLNLIALERKSVADIMHAHWQRFGRHYYRRHDYENLTAGQGAEVISRLRQTIPTLPGQTQGDLTVTEADEFSYLDPVDGSSSEHQGLRIIFGAESRIVVRLSGTGTRGATLRVYLERYSKDSLDMDADIALRPLADIARQILALEKLTGRNRPDLVT